MPPEKEFALPEPLGRNIQALFEARSRFDRSQTRAERFAAGASTIVGSAKFLAVQAVFIALWIVLNAGVVPGVRPWDPFPFALLAVVVSVEAIFLATLVLVAQNKMVEAADRRAELDLHVNLLAEHEVTKLISLASAIADKLGVEGIERVELEILKQEIAPEVVLEVIEEAAPRSRARPR